MQRDFSVFKKWEDWNRDIQLKDYNKEVAKNEKEGKKSKPFQFDKSGLLHYGKCTKLNKDVSFIPVTCTPQNSNCFKHRKDK